MGKREHLLRARAPFSLPNRKIEHAEALRLLEVGQTIVMESIANLEKGVCQRNKPLARKMHDDLLAARVQINGSLLRGSWPADLLETASAFNGALAELLARLEQQLPELRPDPAKANLVS